MGLSCAVICVILRLAVLIQYRSVTDTHTHTHRRTDRQTDTRRRHIPRLARRRAVKTINNETKRNECSVVVWVRVSVLWGSERLVAGQHVTSCSRESSNSISSIFMDLKSTTIELSESLSITRHEFLELSGVQNANLRHRRSFRWSRISAEKNGMRNTASIIEHVSVDLHVWLMQAELTAWQRYYRHSLAFMRHSPKGPHGALLPFDRPSLHLSTLHSVNVFCNVISNSFRFICLISMFQWRLQCRAVCRLSSTPTVESE